MHGSTFKSDLLLLTTAAIWGFAFVAQRVGMVHLGPFTFNGIRFALGSLSLIPLLYFFRNRHGSQTTHGHGAGVGVLVSGSFATGLILFIAASLQQIGLIYTTAGKAGFITGLYVILVPLLGLFWKQYPKLGTWSGACLAAAGLYLLSVTAGFRIAFCPTSDEMREIADVVVEKGDLREILPHLE